MSGVFFSVKLSEFPINLAYPMDVQSYLEFHNRSPYMHRDDIIGGLRNKR
jgi:hypothetical protein